MKNIKVLFMVIFFSGCYNSITGLYKLESRSIPRLYIIINLKPDRSQNYYVSYHGYTDSIYGSWKVLDDTLFLTDERIYPKPDIDFIEYKDFTYKESTLEIKVKSDTINSAFHLININGKDTITDSNGLLVLPFKIDSIKTNKLMTGIDTTYKVKYGNIIKMSYEPKQLYNRFSIETKWLIRGKKLIAIYNDNTIIKVNRVQKH
jgi:hypothetical protein